MIGTTYTYKGKNYNIEFDRYLEEWKCEDLNIHNESLNKLEKEIEKKADVWEKSQKQGIKRINCLYFDYSGARTVEATSVVYNYCYTDELRYEAWIKEEKGRRKTYIKNLYKIDDEIKNLLSARAKIEKKISEWQKEHRYTPKEFIKEMGYSPEYSEKEFKIKI